MPVSNTCDMTFALFDDPATGSPNGRPRPSPPSRLRMGCLRRPLNGVGSLARPRSLVRLAGLQIAVRCPAGTEVHSAFTAPGSNGDPVLCYSLSTGALQGFPISTTTPATADVLQYDGSQWAPSTVNSRRQFYITHATVMAGNAPSDRLRRRLSLASLWELPDVKDSSTTPHVGRDAGRFGNGLPPDITVGFVPALLVLLRVVPVW
ncbi:MAG: hypothetical protein IPL78_25965 [Chloroflexi bacterium]|nr:hypothetical protein [Chloroflexota bacterium]